jgi:hypothetical protein
MYCAPFEAITISVEISIALYSIVLEVEGYKSLLRYCHIGLALMSNNEIVVFKLFQEKEYKNCSFLPNINPKCPQLSAVLPLVCRDQTGLF